MSFRRIVAAPLGERQSGSSALSGEWAAPSTSSWTAEQARDPTYYDVLKCEGEFSTPSVFFLRDLKPARSHRTFPWSSTTAGAGGSGGSAVDNKHRLRRSTVQATGSGASQHSDSAGSSALLAHAESSLPASVFRLPTGRAAVGGDPESREPWALSGMTAGGRALRRANQVTLSRFDRKVMLA
ncbi:hypothetical protein LPJ61_001269 [Coemansia biformis]|uniref:Uncharacterized protein n=1 Tax=Coemansia biformis TaxID=1286918 RepID=A0A9W7YH89_9FUNG|nr:hypothetical protein LPJ61_001269 [Coemansia biformis]